MLCSQLQVLICDLEFTKIMDYSRCSTSLWNSVILLIPLTVGTTTQGSGGSQTIVVFPGLRGSSSQTDPSQQGQALPDGPHVHVVTEWSQVSTPSSVPSSAVASQGKMQWKSDCMLMYEQKCQEGQGVFSIQERIQSQFFLISKEIEYCTFTLSQVFLKSISFGPALKIKLSANQFYVGHVNRSFNNLFPIVLH